MKVLVFQTAFLGDLLLSIPLLKNLKRVYPGCEISLVCRKPFSSFFIDTGLVDKAFEVDKKNKASMAALDVFLQVDSYDLLLCPHESFRSARLCSKVNAKKKVSFRRWFSRFFFTHLVSRPGDLPDALRQSSLLVPMDKEFGMKWIDFVSTYRGANKQTIAELEGDRIQIPEFLSMTTSLKSSVDLSQIEGLASEDLTGCIAIAPGSVWATKRWRDEHFVSFAKSRTEKVVVLGSPGEMDLCEKISSQIPNSINLAGKTSLVELLAILSSVKFLVSNDSGTMHMAVAAGCKTVSVFGPTTLDIGYRPWSNDSLVAQIDLKCRPCGKHGHDKCPIKTHECMTAVLPAQLETIISQWDTTVR